MNGEDELYSNTEVGDNLTETTVSHAKTHAAFGTALEWLEAQGDVDSVHLQLVKKWRDIAAMKRLDCLRQSTISSFFCEVTILFCV